MRTCSPESYSNSASKPKSVLLVHDGACMGLVIIPEYQINRGLMTRYGHRHWPRKSSRNPMSWGEQHRQGSWGANGSSVVRCSLQRLRNS